MIVLQADSIAKTYGGQRVLTAASLSARSGEIVGLLGRMGAGKSTLLKISAGLERPDSGWVRFADVQYVRPRLYQLAQRGMYFLAEDRNLIPTLTVQDHLARIEQAYGTMGVADAVRLMNLEPLLGHRVFQLSGGERRRVEIAAAVSRKPRCLLADEPFRGVDPLVVELIGNAFNHIAASGCAVVITGHEIRSLVPFLHRVVWVTAGTTYALGNTDEAWQNDRFRREYLGSLT